MVKRAMDAVLRGVRVRVVDVAVTVEDDDARALATLRADVVDYGDRAADETTTSTTTTKDKAIACEGLVLEANGRVVLGGVREDDDEEEGENGLGLDVSAAASVDVDGAVAARVEATTDLRARFGPAEVAALARVVAMATTTTTTTTPTEKHQLVTVELISDTM